MTSSSDERLASEFSARRAQAEAYLWGEMEKLGLRASDGWSITESTRDRGGGSLDRRRHGHQHRGFHVCQLHRICPGRFAPSGERHSGGLRFGNLGDALDQVEVFDRAHTVPDA